MNSRFESGTEHKCWHSANKTRYSGRSNVLARRTAHGRAHNAVSREAQRPGASPSVALRKVPPVRRTVLSSVLASRVPVNLETFPDIAGQDEISKAETEVAAENQQLSFPGSLAGFRASPFPAGKPESGRVPESIPPIRCPPVLPRGSCPPAGG